MNTKYLDHFNKFRSSFSWYSNEEDISNNIANNKVIKEIRASVAKKRIDKRNRN